MMVNGHHKTVLQPTLASTTVSCPLTHIVPPPLTSLIYPERFNSSSVQAMPSGSHIHADIGATIHVDNIALVQAAASQIPQTVQPPLIAVENLQATASGADIQWLPNLPCISPSIVANMWINTSPSPPISSSTAVADIWINMESNDESDAHANIGTNIRQSPNLPRISPTIVANMWINTSPSPPLFPQCRSG